METQKERLNYFKKFDYPKHAYTIFKNKKVTVHLNDDSTITGYIIKEYVYEIILIKSEGIKSSKTNVPLEKQTLIPKHSIKSVEHYSKI